MQLLAENAELTRKLSRLAETTGEVKKSALERELEAAETKIADLAKALHDTKGVGEVEIIDEKAKLAELNAALTEKVLKSSEELIRTQSQLQDANDKADLLEFRVFELEEEAEKAKITASVDLSLPDDRSSIMTDSGCASSTTTESADLLDLYQDFRVRS